MGKKISFILFSIILLGIFSISFADTISIDTISIGEIEDDFVIEFDNPISGVCNDTYQDKNIFQVPSDICISGTFDSTTKTCKGENGGSDEVCTFNIILPPTEGDHIENPTEIIWKWKNNDKNGEETPKGVKWFPKIPNQTELDNAPKNSWGTSYTQEGLTPNTSYTGYVVAFDDLGEPSEPIKLTGSTKKTPSGGGSSGGGRIPTPPKEEPKDEDKTETPKEEEKNDDPTPTKEKPSTPSTPTDPQDPKQEEKPEKSTPVYPIIKHPKRTCEPNELIMETRCIYPNIDFTLNDIQDNFAYKYIYSLASAGIVQGYYDTGLFQPDNSISRSEYLKILFKAFCIEYSETSTQNIPFTDVESENWEAKIIAKALELDIISKENTLFRPHQAISRAESMKLLFKVAGVIPQDVHVGLFEDVPNETWEVKYIQKAYESCIIDGKEIQGNLYFEPYQNTTRAEVAKIIANALMLER